MSKGIVSSIAALVIIIAVIIFMKMQGPDLSPYLALRDPAIRTMPSQRVLEVEARGAPGKVGKKAFGLLMKAYYGVKGVSNGGPDFKPPRARWPVAASTPQDEWIGRYAMPLPDSIQVGNLPKAPEGMSIRVTTWEYGEVAEILHIGPYSRETPTIERLRDFIGTRGYRIVGEHEEEYCRGPGMFFRGNPEKYYTVIRYRVEKVDSTALALLSVKAIDK
jgi:effector-binding domain-containing protein